MNIILTTEQKEILKDVRNFAKANIRPFAASFDEQQALPRSLIEKLAEKKYLAATFPKEYGGLDLDPITYGLLTEEIGKACCNTRALLTVQVSIVGESILKWGTKEQINRWIPQMSSGAKIGAFALTEPAIGSDARNVQTSYVKDGNKYLISGEKKWISFGDIADMFLVVARNKDEITTFIVEREAEGIVTKPMKGLLGCRASHVAEIELNNVVVPEENVLGKAGYGFRDVVATALDHGRYSIAWGGVAVAQAALEAMVSYSRERTQFGQKIRSFQLIKEIIGNAVTQTHAARAICLRAGELRKAGDPDAAVETCIAKYFCSRVAMEVAANAVQVHGGNGCYNKYPVERYYREAKILEIIEGTSQIQQQIIASYGIKNYYLEEYPFCRGG